MKTAFSIHWRSSKNPRKQKKYVYNAPSHLRGSFLNAPLSKELRKKYNTRSIRVRNGDRVMVTRGQFKGKSGVVNNVDVARSKIYVDGVELSKKDGSKVPYPIHPSNVVISAVSTDADKKRFKKIESKE